MTYVLLIWATLSTGPSFASHDFASLPICESFAHWLEKDMQAHHVRAVCVPKKDYQI